jgi:signal peptidase II
LKLSLNAADTVTDTQKRYALLLAPIAGVILLDQGSKYWIRHAFEWHRRSIIDGVFDFTYIRNSGMALGIDWFDTWIVGVISILATVLITAVTIRSLREATSGYLFLMGCILGGAMGNIIDRIFLARIEGTGGWLEGHVVDFLHFSLEINGWAVFPYIFNVADAFISVSVVVLLVFHKKLMPHPVETAEAAPVSGENQSEAAS